MSRRTTDVRVQIYESEYKAIVAEARRLAQTETGGDLYGTFTHGNNPVIWLASGPGPRVRHEHTHFEQDTSFTTYWEGRLTRDFGVQYIGSWHSHHFLGLQEPSSGDVGAAQLYAQQHNREMTLEIIVNHQRGMRRGDTEFTTILRPYFYPDAKRARAEKFVLAEFVPLAGVSPLRRQLGADELAKFNVIDWQKAADFQFPLFQAAQRPVAQGSDGDAVVVPDLLGYELQGIADYQPVRDFDIQQSSAAFLIRVTLNNGGILAVVVNKPPELRIAQVRLIDQAREINEDITNRLHQRIHFTMRQGNIGVFRKLVQETLYIQRSIVQQSEVSLLQEQPAMVAVASNEGQQAAITSQQQLAEAQRQIQEQRDLAEKLNQQRLAAQNDLNRLRMESHDQLIKQEIEINQLKAELDGAKQQLVAYEENMKAYAEISNQRSEDEQQMSALRGKVGEYENRLLEAQKDQARQKQLEVQLNEAQAEIETQKQNAEVLQRSLSDFQARLAAQDQLVARLNTAQEQLDTQQCAVEKLQAELNEARSQLQASREKLEQRPWPLPLPPFFRKNRDDPPVQVGTRQQVLMTITSAVVVLLILIVVLVFILGRMRLL